MTGYLLLADPSGSTTPNIPDYAYTVSPLTWDYGSHEQNQADPTKDFLITNTGASGLTFTFTDSTNFYTDDAGFSLASGQSQNVTFKADTANQGLHSEIVVVNESNAGNTNIGLGSNITAPSFVSGVTTLTSSGDFILPAGCTLLEYTIVAGGAGGAGAITSFGASGTNNGGAGGAGGMLQGSFSTPASGTYPIVIGAGGVAGQGVNSNSIHGSNGGDSTGFGLTAIGGGYGVGTQGTITFAGDGGSGGGGSRSRTGSLKPAGSGTVGQGNNGAAGSTSGGGGGGGAGAAGASNVGGAGAASTINGTTYAAGGSGRQSRGNGTAGAANTGNGGGGAAADTVNTNYNGGAGGSGIVILRYT